jgi:DNA-binding MarR family transcriptional regulator
MVDKLEGPGYVVRGTDPHSRSIVTVEVTPVGRDIVTAVLERRHELLESVLDAMTADERDLAAAVAGRFVLLAGDAVAAGAKAPVAL